MSDREDLRRALREMLDEAPNGRDAFAAACAEEIGWTSGAGTWLGVISRWTSPTDTRDAPGWALCVAQKTLCPLGARDRLAPIQARSAFLAQELADEVAPQRAPMAKARTLNGSSRRQA